MEYSNALQRLGLSEKESTIYEELLNKGSLSMLKLSQATGINRPVLYNLIPKLIKLGLVIETKKGKRIEYIASSPNKLEPLVKNAQQSLDNIVSNLNTEFSKKQIVPKIETYYGEEGIVRIFMDIVTTLNKGDRYYRYSIKRGYEKTHLPKEYYRIKEEKNIERMVITTDEIAKRKIPDMNRSIKVMKGNYAGLNVNKMIYGNKIAYIDYENKVAFIVYNEGMAKLEKEIFMSLYNML